MKNTGKRIFRGAALAALLLLLAGCAEMYELPTEAEQVEACQWYVEQRDENIWGPGQSGLLDYYRERIVWCRAEGYL